MGVDAADIYVVFRENPAENHYCGGTPLPPLGAGRHLVSSVSFTKFVVSAPIDGQWVKRDSVSAVPNFSLSSSLHSSPDDWLSNFSIM